ncbi:hypothetical protein FACS1894172_13770 [Spirochaetia bacterium]|nr:hypothetical protein FACS1894164_16190 [Spirochaetia bacterium]GHU34045.1 hypothetical protein FACS1894172_13770 [Spirochaetia bacterium]
MWYNIVLWNIWNYLAPAFPFMQIEERNNVHTNASRLFYSLITGMLKKGIAEGICDPEIDPGVV